MAEKKKVTKKVSKRKPKGTTKKIMVEVEVPIYGRPSKYDPKFCDTVRYMMSKGYSQEACSGEIGVSYSTFNLWKEKHQDFSEATAIGMQKARLFFDKVMVNHITHSKNGQQINGQVYALNMKNRFGFSDKKEIDIGEKTLPVIKLAYSLDEPLEDDKED